MIPPLLTIQFSNDRARDNWHKMQPRLQELANEMSAWLSNNYQWTMVITETVTTKEEDTALNRVSVTHREGRAFDVRIRDWSDDMIAKFCAYFRKQHPNLGAVSQQTSQRSLIVYKPHGTAVHFHVQIKRGY